MIKPGPHNISLRPAKKSDLLFFFNLRNEQAVRQSAFSTSEVSLETHSKWFMNKLADNNAYLFVVEQGTIRAGQVRIDISSTSGEIDVAVASLYRGRGYAVWGIKQAVKAVFDKRDDVLAVIAHIKPENTQSLKTFTKAGFSNYGKVIFAGHTCIEMRKERHQ